MFRVYVLKYHSTSRNLAGLVKMLLKKLRSRDSSKDKITVALTDLLARLSDEKKTVAYIKELMREFESSADPSLLLAAIGVSLMKDINLGINALVTLSADREVMTKYPKAWKGVIQLQKEFVGISEVIRRIYELGLRPSRKLYEELMAGASCYDLTSVSSLFYVVPPSKDLLLTFVKESMNNSDCTAVKKEALKLLSKSLLAGTITPEELRALLKGNEVKIVIVRKNGSIKAVKLYLNGELVTEEANEHVLGLITALSSLGSVTA